MESLKQKTLNKDFDKSMNGSKSEINKKQLWDEWDQKFGSNRFEVSSIKQKKWDDWDQKYGQPQQEISTTQSPTDQQIQQNNQQTPQQKNNVNQTPSMVLLWNQKNNPSYKLRYYNYFVSTPEINSEVNNYNKFEPKGSNPPNLSFYMRFSPYVYETELDKRNHFFYGSLMEDPVMSNNIVYNKRYEGVYSRQTDYFQFKDELLYAQKQSKQSAVN